MQRIIDAENRDLFDVLAHVAYAMAPLTREERAVRAKVEISTHFNSKQQAFLDFVLAQYVRVGVEELSQDKLSPLLRLKYHGAIADAVATSVSQKRLERSSLGFRDTYISHRFKVVYREVHSLWATSPCLLDS